MATPMLQNPFDFGFADVVMPSAEKAAAASPSSAAAATRFDGILNGTKLLFDTCIGLPSMEPKWFEWVISGEPIDAWLDEPPPSFLGDPSIEFTDMIAAMHRDVLPLLEDAVRRAG